jgi:hypothetical protein
MKPQSIRRFDLFFLASLALLVAGFAVSFDATVASVQAQTAAKGLQVGAGFVLGIFAAVLVIDLLLWFFVSRKGASIAKWLLVLLLILDLLGVPSLLGNGLSAPTVISLLRILFETVAIGFLFTADAKTWFAGTPAEAADGPGDAA